MDTLESKIDELYQKPLDQFTAARNALAKTVSGAEAARVRKLAKPTVVPWTVNQLYWDDAGRFERLRKSGERLRAAQIAALKGQSADVRGATEAHRRAIADAATRALGLAEAASSHPAVDELTRTLEALSLATDLLEPPGRFTRPLQPAGFEALAGIAPIAASPKKASRAVRAAEDAAKRRDQDEARRAEAHVKEAEAALDRATHTEARAHATWERAKRDVDAAERALARARSAQSLPLKR